MKKITVLTGAGISAEMVRTFRNMTGLTVKKVAGPHGKDGKEDRGIDLVRAYPDRDELQIQILSKLNLPQQFLIL